MYVDSALAGVLVCMLTVLAGVLACSRQCIDQYIDLTRQCVKGTFQATPTRTAMVIPRKALHQNQSMRCKGFTGFRLQSEILSPLQCLTAPLKRV